MPERDITTNMLLSKLKEQFYNLLVHQKVNSFQDYTLAVSFILKNVFMVKHVTIYVQNELAKTFETFDSYPSPLFGSNVPKVQLLNKYSQHTENRIHIVDDKHIVIFLAQHNHLRGVIVFDLPSEFSTSNILTIAEKIANEVYHVLDKGRSHFASVAKERKFQILYQLNYAFSIKMKQEEVFKEMLRTISNVFPHYEYYILLQDVADAANLPIKKVDIYNENKASVQAYLNGQIQLEDISADKKAIYAPLQGKQGVYGVLEIIVPKNELLSKENIEFMTEIANITGCSLENVSLYDQSKRMIQDLEIVNESSQHLNSAMKLSETYTFMYNLIKNSFHAEEIGFILNQKEQKAYRILEESSEFFKTEIGLSFVNFLYKELEYQEDSIFIGDFDKEYPDFDIPYQSVMAIPMIHEGNIVGLVIVLHPLDYYFSFETFKLLKSLVQHSTLTVVNSLLKEELEQLVRTDYLTKLYSRKYLDEMMNKHIHDGSKGSFILIDIDNFKRINDKYGHDVGDQIILQVANIIRDNIRSHDIAARWGGEELAIYLPNTPVQASMQIAERLVEKVASATYPKVTISCGISYWDEKLPEQTQDIFQRADQALYIAKEQGKNQVVRHDEIFN